MDDELRNRLDALEMAMRATVAAVGAHNVYLHMAWEAEREKFIRELPDEEACRARALREAMSRLWKTPHM